MDFFNINKFSVYSISFNVIHWLMPSKLYLCLLVLYLICVVAWSCPGSMWSGEIFVKRSSNIGWIVFWLRLEAMTRCLGWVLRMRWLSQCVVGSVNGCVVMCVVGWVGDGWLCSWLSDGMTVCWLCSEMSEGCLRPVVVGSMNECVVMCVVGWVGLAACVLHWVVEWLCWLCSEMSEGCLRPCVHGWVHEWVCIWVWWGEWGLLGG